MKIFGFGHRSRVGKSTAGDFLTGYIRQTKRNVSIINTNFASKMKAMCHDLYSWAGLQDEAYYEANEAARDIKLPFINKTPVEIWIEFATNVGRTVYVHTWIRYPFTYKCNYLIIRDVRFENEIDIIREHGGFVFKIANDSAPVRASIADQQLQNYKEWDGILYNNGDLKEFNSLIISTFKELI